MLSDLMAAELTDAEGTIRQLTSRRGRRRSPTCIVSAGTETVARLLGWAAVLLDQHPDQRADLAANPDVIPNAVEELLRYEAPSPVQGRWPPARSSCTASTIPADSKVLLLTGSAGRDERKYPDGESLRRAPDASTTTSRSATASTSASAPRSARLGGPHRPRGGAAPAGPSGPSTTTPPSACTRARCAGWINVPVTA